MTKPLADGHDDEADVLSKRACLDDDDDDELGDVDDRKERLGWCVLGRLVQLVSTRPSQGIYGI